MIATTLEVDAVLTATLMRAGDQLRVSAQLVEAPSGTVQWSHQSQTGLGDLFTLQDNLTRQIVESLAVPLSRDEERALEHDVPGSARAYEFYLRAAHYGHRNETEQARDLYLRCVEEDPKLRAGVGAALAAPTAGSETGATGRNRPRMLRRRKTPCVGRWTSTRTCRSPTTTMRFWSWTSVMPRRRCCACSSGRSSIAPNPELLAGLLHALRYCGLLKASVAAFEKAQRLDPNVVTSVCHTFWMLGDTHRAVETEREGARMMGMLAALRAGQTAPVIAELKRRAATTTGAALVTTRAFLAVLERDTEAFGAPFDALAASTRDPENLYYSALMAAYVGDVERCLTTLERAVQGGWLCYATIAGEPWLACARDAPRFAAVVAEAETRHGRAAAAFRAAGGNELLGLPSDS